MNQTSGMAGVQQYGFTLAAARTAVRDVFAADHHPITQEHLAFVGWPHPEAQLAANSC